MNRNILLSGVGGQGILLAERILASAASEAGFQTATNEIHGMAQRGGSVTAQIRFGDGIRSPLIVPGTADVIYSMELTEALRYAHLLKKGGLAVVSASRVIPVTVTSGKGIYPADAEARLRKVFPRLILKAVPENMPANTMMLGAVANELPEIPAPCWEKAIRLCVKPAFVEMNLTAFAAGKQEFC